MTNDSLRVIALISGGKDSLFSILHCLKHGHTVVALANLHPQFEELEDVDSYMYQTVGHTIVPLYEEALDIPLYRQPITGGALDTERDYRALVHEGFDDETEALLPLLKRVKAAHPFANAISTGAILSTYQRTRVESVALRLGLVPLSYLWQFPSLPPYTQSQLLRDIKAVGQDARIIKVASGGLDETFLGAALTDDKVIRRLMKSVDRFGSVGDGAVLGEGGEFETLAVDGPPPLWRKRISLDEEVIIRGEGGSSTLRINRASLVEKPPQHEAVATTVRTPQLLDDDFLRLFRDLRKAQPASMNDKAHSEVESPQQSTQEWAAVKLDTTQYWMQKQVGNTLYISNMASSDGNDVRDQIARISTEMRVSLRRHSPDLTPDGIVSTLMLLRSMSDFATVNPLYGLLFKEPSPPARVTVACGSCMPDGVDIMLSVAVDLQSPNARSGLHVQSRSYWAPANIGPYSQAIAVDVPLSPAEWREEDDTGSEGSSEKPRPQLVHIAGQIPLVPATMDLAASEEVEQVLFGEVAGPSDVFLLRSVLSLQHLWRIGRCTNVRWWAGAVVFLPVETDRAAAYRRTTSASRAWRRIHDNVAADAAVKLAVEDDGEGADGGLDVWDLRNGMPETSLSQGSDVPWHQPLPEFTNTLLAKDCRPPVFAAEVEELPRGADVEWMTWGITSTDLHVDVDANGLHSLKMQGTDLEMFFTAFETEMDLQACLERLPDASHSMLFLSTSRIAGTPIIGRSVAYVPCRRLWREQGTEVAALLIANCSLGRKSE